MRTSIIRLAESVSGRPITAKQVSQALLPPLVLYRRLLRSHRKHLPLEMRLLGDDYVKAEFRRTRKTDNPLHIIGFLSEWKTYLDQLETSGVPAEAQRGQQLDPRVLEKMSPEQIGQLYELMMAARGEGTEAQREEQIAETLTKMGIPHDSDGAGSQGRD